MIQRGAGFLLATRSSWLITPSLFWSTYMSIGSAVPEAPFLCWYRKKVLSAEPGCRICTRSPSPMLPVVIRSEPLALIAVISFWLFEIAKPAS